MKALGILKAVKEGRFIAYHPQSLALLDEAIAELETLQAPKTCDGCINDGKHIALHPCSSCIRGAAVDFYQAYPTKDEEFRGNM